MIPLEIQLEGDNAWPEFRDRDFEHGMADGIAVLPNGTEAGHPAIMLKITKDDGETVFAETTWRLLYTACRAIEARYGPAQD